MKSRLTGFFLVAMILAAAFLWIPSLAAGTDKAFDDKSSGQADKNNKTALSLSDALIRSRELISQGKYGEALSVLAPYISDPVKYPHAVSDYISILVWDGRPDDAINKYEKLPPEFPGPAYLLRNVAKAYYDKKEYSRAFKLYHAAYEQAPSDEEAQKGIVLSLIQSGDLEKASDYLNKFLSKDPDSLSLSRLKVDLLSAQGNIVEALEMVRSISKKEGRDTGHIYKLRHDFIASLSDEARRSLANALKKQAEEGDNKALPDYILLLVTVRDYETVVKIIETTETDISQYPEYILNWTAWAYFQTNNTKKAKEYYEKILAAGPDSISAGLGLAYCLAKEKQTAEAGHIIAGLLLKDPENSEIMFGQAYVYETSGMFWDAIEVYNRLLKINRRNIAAGRLRIVALSDLGASSHALEIAAKELPQDVKLHELIEGDMAADRINWKEFPAAIEMLKPLAEDKKNVRARYDYVAARVENEDMKEAVRVYEELVKEGVPVSAWLMENIAGAYLYLEQPYKALELYNRALEISPSFNSRIGKFYALQEIRKWKDAAQYLDDLDRDTPEAFGSGKNLSPNWDKMEIALGRGWLLLYEDRLQEAEQYFYEMHEKAPMDTGFRTGLSHAYLWRGWPRKALREFEITETIDPKEVKVKIGKASTLDQLAFREQAREDTAALLNKYPRNKQVLALARELKLEEMREIVTDITFTGDDDGFQEISARAGFTQPVSLYTDIYGFGYWKRSSENKDDLLTYYRRAGLGAEHIFNSDWSGKQEFSANYNDGKNFGSLTQLTYTPDDYWTFGLSYDSFATDVPIRARVLDIEADKSEANVTYRESEWRSYSLSFSHSNYSDDNRRYQGMLGYEQGLWSRDNWRERIFLDLYSSFNSLDEAEYFNPDNDLSLSVTHMTEHTVRRMYGKAFVYRLYLTIGAYKQAGYSIQPSGSVKYEHDINLSDTHSLLYGASVGSQTYDGEAVTAYSFYLKWRLLF
ncbi:MAG: tetratricopeptide repeat protein [Nitrospirae bacterium]|nr:tetratricopeptide repeat protein [Nitrospirota bacterium]